MQKAIQQVFAAMMMAFSAHPLAALNGQADDVSLSRQNAITRSVRTCSPAIVGINVTETRQVEYQDPFGMDQYFSQFFGQRQPYREQYTVKGLGSGFLISSDGYIVTNDHVAGNATKIVVTMTDGKEYPAKIIGTDRTADVALLKIEASGLPSLRLANSDDVVVGEWAIAFGNPFGLFDINAKPTVTVGVVSNMGVNFTQPDERGEERVYRGMLQTDAAISSGNSGGPLVNSNGEVIGMNTVIYSTAQSSRGAGSIGIGFAIPINRVKRIIDRFKSDGVINRDFWTGMVVRSIDERVAKYYGLSVKTGVIVERVINDSPADAAGIEPGDVIVEVDGLRIHRDEDVNVAILDGEVGKSIALKVRRGEAEKSVTMILKQRPRSGGVRN
ncbi:MAG: trypsin-like peptidase domain-containing protein [Bacteroidetes bacterium]|nr:trypsin-like peptidase domain-containing protein [Bacteroidota bacterium]